VHGWYGVVWVVRVIWVVWVAWVDGELVSQSAGRRAQGDSGQADLNNSGIQISDLTSDCGLLELEKFVSDEANNQTRFTDRGIPQQHELEVADAVRGHR
jgi:hypothetical protein